MILVDANVILYAAGATHSHREPSLRYLERVATGEIEATTDAEVLQEVLHRYRAIGRWTEGRRVYDLARELFPMVVPITPAETDRARRLLDEDDRIAARDALHAAVVLINGLDGICSYDRDFDRIKGIVRREP